MEDAEEIYKDFELQVDEEEIRELEKLYRHLSKHNGAQPGLDYELSDLSEGIQFFDNFSELDKVS